METILESKLNFDFGKDILKALRPSSNRKSLEYIGTATCDFQAEPLVYGKNGKPLVKTDWELNVVNKLSGKKSSVKGTQNSKQFPRFLPNKQLYIERSLVINQNMFRFSLDCGRLCPREGEFNSELMEEYVNTLGMIKTHGQEPMLALYHWPMPRYLLKINQCGDITAGGWENQDAVKHFRFYIENVVKFLADENKVINVLANGGFDKKAQDQILSEGLCRYFLSINEPINILLPTYIIGIFPPYKKGRFDLINKVLGKLVEVHDIIRDQIKTSGIKTTQGEPQIGVAHNWTYFDGLLGNTAHCLINKKLTERFERSGEYTDFLGLQYYFRLTIPQFSRNGKMYGNNPHFGDIYPSGIYELLKKINSEWKNKDIFITEFGFSDYYGLRQPYWILETVRYILKALACNIPVKGMLLWTLVNNFEWNLGMGQKFGLFSEAELKEPLESSLHKELRGWQAWQTVAKMITNPSSKNLRELENIYMLAKKQFEIAIA